MMNNWKISLKKELSKSLPGATAWKKMEPLVRRELTPGQPLKKAGILILVYPVEKELHLVFIKRVEYEGVHSGQISFPGGIFEAQDTSLRATALREAMEETGIRISDITVIGGLSTLYIPASRIEVYPFVGVASKRPSFHHNPAEVQYLIETKIKELINPVCHQSKILFIEEEPVEVPFYDLGNDIIWGATAMILSEFLEIADNASVLKQ